MIMVGILNLLRQQLWKAEKATTNKKQIAAFDVETQRIYRLGRRAIALAQDAEEKAALEAAAQKAEEQAARQRAELSQWRKEKKGEAERKRQQQLRTMEPTKGPQYGGGEQQIYREGKN
jgi:hypothetical protein